MKTKSIISAMLFLIFFSISSYSYDFQIFDEGLDFQYCIHGDYHNSQYAILGQNNSSSQFDTSGVALYKEGKWRILPKEINTENGTSNLFTYPSSEIHFDSSDNIWVSGYSMYKYSEDEWEEIYIDDEDREKRKYWHFAIDKFNNVWVTTEVFYGPEKHYSELLKYDGSEFHSIFKTSRGMSFYPLGTSVSAHASPIAALPDGRIMVQRMHHADEYSDPDAMDTVKGLYIFNQDHSYENILLETNTKVEYKNKQKSLVKILPETNDKIWFALDYTSWTDKVMKFCCSGISIYENGEWMLFGEENGLENLGDTYDGVYMPITGMTKLKNGKMLVLSREKIYNIDQNNYLHELSWSEIFNSSKILISNSYYKTDKGIKKIKDKFDRVLDEETDGILKVLTINETPDNEIWLLSSFGLMMFEQALVSVGERTIAENSGLLYPNPAYDKVNIKDFEKYRDFE
ncbi:MAG: hypothetical protein ACLFQU_05590, partial [Candidatus Kapaibacterium sp.]